VTNLAMKFASGEIDESVHVERGVAGRALRANVAFCVHVLFEIRMDTARA
jgi:hypothetical protein